MKLAPIAAGSLLGAAAHGTCLGGQNTSLPISTPTSDFSVAANGTVIAMRTQLMWARCLVGQTLVNGLCTGDPSVLTWADALNTAKAATLGGHNDWRLPNVKELVSITEDRCYLPSLNGEVFPIQALYTAWSSTPSAVNLANEFDEAWAVDGNGYIVRITKYQSLGVLLVRDAH